MLRACLHVLVREIEDKCSVGELSLTDFVTNLVKKAQKAIENVNDLFEDEQVLLKLRTASEKELHAFLTKVHF